MVTDLMHIRRSANQLYLVLYGSGSPHLDNIHKLLGSVSVSFTNLYLIRQAAASVASRNFYLVFIYLEYIYYIIININNIKY